MTENRIVIDPDCRDGKHDACIGRAWDEEADEWVPCGCMHHLQFQFAPHLPVALVPLGGTITLGGEPWTIAAVAPGHVLIAEGAGRTVEDDDPTTSRWLSWAELNAAMRA